MQERDNFAFVLAGLANSAIESPELYGAPNPLFSYARPFYLQPFDVQETEELLNGIGKRVSLHWHDDAVAVTHAMSGGHALLLRELASGVLKNQRHARSNIVQVRPGVVHLAVPQWRIAVASHVRDVLPHLRRYYEDEADLAVMLMEDAATFEEYVHAYGDSISRLEHLGVIVRSSEGNWEPTQLLRFSHDFEERPGVENLTTGERQELRSIEELVLAEESELLERKESLRSHGGKVPDEVIVHQVLKACLGFLNRYGGVVLVGIGDNGTIVGIERDLSVCGGVDSLIQFLTAKVRDHIGNVGVDLISPSCETLGASQILVVRVSPAPSPVFPTKAVDKKDGLFVRNNNTTQVLTGKDALEYAQRHWKPL